MKIVQQKASWIPRNVTGVTLDSTATPELVISIDTSKLPANATLDKKTGDITITEALELGELKSAMNITTDQPLPSNSFTLGVNSIVIHPRVLDGTLYPGINTLRIETTLAIVTITVEKGSVKVLKIEVERKKINTPLVPGTISCTTTTITTQERTTCTMTPIDPDGVGVVTATFNGMDVPVTKN